MSLHKVVIVGGSLAGLSAAETLRSRGFDGSIELISGEKILPYDRPPLSKQALLGTCEPADVMLREEKHYSDLALDIRLGVHATALDARRRRLDLDTGESLAFDGLIVATGLTPRSLPMARGMSGVFSFRTMSDCIALRASLAGSPRVVVIGAGLIGTEVASSARALGLKVTIVEPQMAPLSRMLPATIGNHLAELYRDSGVDLRLGVTVEEFRGGEQVEMLRLSDGSVVPADVVVLGIGAAPNTDWLKDSGLSIGDGIVCDEFCSAWPGIYAAGDVARWRHATLDRTMRLEHWTNAFEQGRTAASNLMDRSAPKAFSPVSYCWSDQWGQKIQIAGDLTGVTCEKMIWEAADKSQFIALYEKNGLLHGAVGMNSSHKLLRCRRMIAQGVSWSDALQTLEGVGA